MASLHKIRTHPGPDVPGCFGCKAASLHIAHSSEWSQFKQRETVLSRDLDAYARLRSEGMQPEKVDGAADLESKATHRIDVEQASNPFIKHMTGEQKTQYVAATTGSPE